MQRFFPYLGIVFALLVAAVAADITRVTVVEHAPEAQTASSTLVVVPSLTPLPISLANLFALATSSAPASSSPAVQKPEPQKTTKAPAPAAAPAPAKKPATATTQTPATEPAASSTQPTLATSGNASLDASAAALRTALVNIICEAPAGSSIRSISGSGIIVSNTGFILTNAHVAQYFLLADRGVSCEVRKGSPAHDAYRAALAYFPAAWLNANASLITQMTPSGNGEHDYALLAITGSASGNPLPGTFGFVPLGSAAPTTGEPVVIGSYGAQFLTSSQVISSLFPTLVFGSVKGVYTFNTNSADVIALGGSAAAQEGSSGGGVCDAAGNLIGTIVTSTISGSTADRNVNAITASYIRADYASATGAPLDLLLSEPTDRAVNDFAPSMPSLEAVLTAAIDAAH